MLNRRLLYAATLAVAAVTATPLLGGVASAATLAPPYRQCPAVGASASCQILVVINADRSVSVLGDPAVTVYDGSDDTLVGVLNNSKTAVSAITVNGPGTGLAGLDHDGLCTYNVAGCPFGPTSYEGPGTTIVTSAALADSAEIDFTGGLAAGHSTYFSLEGALTSARLTARQGHLTGPTLSLSTSVKDLPVTPDPGGSAFVRLSITTTNGDGTPAANAAITFSNSKATFHTNARGMLSLVEPLDVASASSPYTVTVNATAANGAKASKSQQLYDAEVQAQCSFAGRPGPDLSLLENITLPGEAGAIQGVYYQLLPLLSGLHTNLQGYVITVPNQRPYYAETVSVTNKGKQAYSNTFYSSHQLLEAPATAYEAASTGCSGPNA
jgi:hypothetical protein